MTGYRAMLYAFIIILLIRTCILFLLYIIYDRTMFYNIYFHFFIINLFIFIIINNIVISYDCINVKRPRAIFIDRALYKYLCY